MTKLYADGRPAESGGRQVVYDAGGRPHEVGPMPKAIDSNGFIAAADRLYEASRADVARQMADLREQRVFLRQTLDAIGDVAASAPASLEDKAIWQEVFAICLIALAFTEEIP